MLDHQAYTHDRLSVLPVPYADTEPQHKDRHFNWERVPVTDNAHAVVAQAFEAADTERQKAAGARALSRANRARAEQAVACLVCDAIVHLMSGSRGGLIITRSKAQLDTADPDKPVVKRSSTIRWLDDLVAAGWLCEARGERRAGSRRVATRIAAGGLLEAAVRRHGVTLEDIGHVTPSQVVFLRAPAPSWDRKGERIDFTRTRTVDRLASEVSSINEHLRHADIRATRDWRGRVDLNDRYLRRCFIEGRFDRGGRFGGGFWATMSKADRFEAILIDGEPVAELDFSGMYPRMAYGLAGAEPPPGDLYAIEGVDPAHRKGVKLVMNAMFWIDGRLTRCPRGRKPDLPPGINGKELADLITVQHPALARTFGARTGPHLMLMESTIMTNILLELSAIGITALPVHDAILTARPNVDVVRATMARVFKREAGVEAVLDLKLGSPLH